MEEAAKKFEREAHVAAQEMSDDGDEEGSFNLSRVTMRKTMRGRRGNSTIWVK